MANIPPARAVMSCGNWSMVRITELILEEKKREVIKKRKENFAKEAVIMASNGRFFVPAKVIISKRLEIIIKGSSIAIGAGSSPRSRAIVEGMTATKKAFPMPIFQVAKNSRAFTIVPVIH